MKKMENILNIQKVLNHEGIYGIEKLNECEMDIKLENTV